MLARKREGDMIDLLGPLGTPFRLDASYTTAILVAGGLGIAPFPLAARELKRLGRETVALVGARTKEDVYTGAVENAHYATDDGSLGFHGTVVRLFEDLIDRTHPAEPKVFACGPNAMLRALAEAAHQRGIKCEISLEGEMACGIGICQGCPVPRARDGKKYALVCTDGPVFQSTEVTW